MPRTSSQPLGRRDWLLLLVLLLVFCVMYGLMPFDGSRLDSTWPRPY
jgi:hypothetical protein